MEKNADARETFLDGVYALSFELQRSARYHSARRSFFTRWSKLGSFISVLASGSTIAVLLNGSPVWVTISVACVIAVAQTAELVFDLSGKAMRHEGLYRDFLAVEQRLVLLGEDISDAQLRELKVDRLRLEAGEPPILRWLDVLCHNELAGAMGHRENTQRVGWLQRRLAHYVDLSGVH